MRHNTSTAAALASSLPTFRVALLIGGALVVSESVVLATGLFAGAAFSFVASLLIAAKIYRVRSPRSVEAE